MKSSDKQTKHHIIMCLGTVTEVIKFGCVEVACKYFVWYCLFADEGVAARQQQEVPGNIRQQTETTDGRVQGVSAAAAVALRQLRRQQALTNMTTI